MNSISEPHNNSLLKQNLALLRQEAGLLQEEISILLQAHFEALDPGDASFADAAGVLLGECNRLFEESEDPQYSANIKLWLCKHLAQKYSQEEVLGATDVHIIPVRCPKIAYWASNQYAERALEKFGKLFAETETVLVDSFAQVCDFVEDVDRFGILPIENSADGRLVGFYRLMDKHELKICAVCDIEDDAGETFTRFALVSGEYHHFDFPFPLYIELSVVSPDRSHFMEIIHIAEQLGMTASRMFSVPLYYNRKDAGNDTVTLTMDEKSSLPFFIYLYLFGKDINVLGFYIQI